MSLAHLHCHCLPPIVAIGPRSLHLPSSNILVLSRRTTATLVTILEDALTDRDLVHRQTAGVIIKHIALGVAGIGCEDSLMHSLNLV